MANSYKEAKIKLDSIHTDRLYKKYGIVPPAETDSPAEKINKSLKLQIKLQEESNQKFVDMLKLLKDSQVSQESQAAKELEMLGM